MTARSDTENCFWREDIDSLAFQPEGHNGLCVIHRRAFRTLLAITPKPQDCGAYFETHKDIFQRAAIEKIARAGVSPDGNFHLNSRDIRKAQALLYPEHITRTC